MGGRRVGRWVLLLGAAAVILGAAVAVLDLPVWLALARRISPVIGPGFLARTLDRAVVWIPEGVFWMGSQAGPTDEQPLRQVFLNGFAIDRVEVTNAQYRRFLQATGRPAPAYWDGDMYPSGQTDFPVVGISWTEADAYCRWAGKRLPTEAEWEKACRGEQGRFYPWGDVWDPDALNVGVWPQEVSGTYIDALWPVVQAGTLPGRPSLVPVASFPEGASPYRVYDLAGNVSEWVMDRYDAVAYRKLPATNPVNLDPPWNHVVRGSAWFLQPGFEDALPGMSRCTARNGSHITSDPRIGFRCARSDPPS